MQLDESIGGVAYARALSESARVVSREAMPRDHVPARRRARQERLARLREYVPLVIEFMTLGRCRMLNREESIEIYGSDEFYQIDFISPYKKRIRDIFGTNRP
jgi:hypothetical protein